MRSEISLARQWRWRWRHVLMAAALLLFLFFLLGSDGHSVKTSVFAATLHQSGPDLCAMLPSGPGIEVDPGIGPNGKTQGCTVVDNRGERAEFFEVSISRYGTVADAHRYVDNYYGPNSTAPSSQKAQPSTAYGDPGFSYDLPAVPPTDPSNPANTQKSFKVTFARGCYVVDGDAGWADRGDYHLFPPGPVQAIVAGADAQLKGVACDSGAQPGSSSTETATSIEPTNTPTSTPTQSPTASPTAEVDLAVDHMEVVQVIQTEDNQIPLVAGKKTVVRVFVKAKTESTGLGPYRVQVSLFIWPEGKTEVEVKADLPVMIVKPDEFADRNKLDSSVNFVIPPELTAAGAFSLRAVINSDNSVNETDLSNNEDTEPFEFVQRNGLRVAYVRIGYKPPLESTFAWPSNAIANYDTLLRNLLPAPDAGVQYYEMPYRVRTTRSASTETLGEDLIYDLQDFYDHLQGDKPDILVGWLPKTYTAKFEYGGLAEAANPGFLGHVLLAIDYNSNYSIGTLAHEVGHDLGLEHTGTKSDPSTDCRISENGDPGYWPKEYGDSAVIRLRGFDTVQMKVIPNNYYDIMSYCSPNVWITPFHYKRLYDQNVKPPQEYTAGTVDKILVRGWGWVRGGGGNPRFELVRSSDSGSGGAAQPAQGISSNSPLRGLSLGFADSLLNVAAPPRSTVLQTEGTGSYHLRFIDANGTVLYERLFDPAFDDNESHKPLSAGQFGLEVSNPGKFTQAVILHDEGGQLQEVASLQASSHAPTVTITSPTSGDTWEGEQTIQWTGSDQDTGDATNLTYDILYSPDGKKSWYPLQVDSQGTQYAFSTDEILPSDQTYIRVVASDGFNTSHADVGPLTVQQQANSPKPPPPPASGVGVTNDAGQGTSDAGGGQSSTGSTSAPSLFGLRLGVVQLAVVGAVLALILILLVVLIRRRRPRLAQLPYSGVVTPMQPPSPQAAPPPPPVYPAASAMPGPFLAFEQEYQQLRNALGTGQITPQQFEATIRQMVVRDTYGRAWILDGSTGQWLVYDGRQWVPANPHLPG